VQHPSIGYRQGMHELLAPIFLALDFDSVDQTPSQDDTELGEFCDRKSVSADAFTLFGIVMAQVSEWYEWREPPIVASTQGQLGIKPHVSPIVKVCEKIHSEYLKHADPLLWTKIQEVGVEPQIWGMCVSRP
jgi:TBC1 domain family member 5